MVINPYVTTAKAEPAERETTASPAGGSGHSASVRPGDFRGRRLTHEGRKTLIDLIRDNEGWSLYKVMNEFLRVTGRPVSLGTVERYKRLLEAQVETPMERQACQAGLAGHEGPVAHNTTTATTDAVAALMDGPATVPIGEPQVVPIKERLKESLRNLDLREPVYPVPLAQPDPELAAMDAVHQAIKGLKFDAMRRVLTWAADRHGYILTIGPKGKHE